MVAEAIGFVAQMARARLPAYVAEEFSHARAAGLETVLADLGRPAARGESPTSPPEKVVSEDISGVDVLELEEAVHCLWEAGIYATSGMGCSGPVIMVAAEDLEEAVGQLQAARFLSEAGGEVC